MKRFGPEWCAANIVAWLIKQASNGLYEGINTAAARRYHDACTCCHYPTGSILTLTRDQGLFMGGFMGGLTKSRRYDRRWHLSISFRDPETGRKIPRNGPVSATWINAVFGVHQTEMLSEAAVTAEGVENDQWHYYLFVEEDWKTGVEWKAGDEKLIPKEWMRFPQLLVRLSKEAIQ